MTRVLFFAHDPSLYGAQLSLLGLLSKLDRSKFEAIVVAPRYGPLVDAITDLGIPVKIRESVWWVAAGTQARASRLRLAKNFVVGLKGRVSALVDLINGFDVDVVYTNTLVPIEAAIAARLTRRPHIWHLREQVQGNTQLKSFVPYWLIPHVIGYLSSRIIVNSRYLSMAYARGHARSKIEVIYNGVDPTPFDLTRQEAATSLRGELGLDNSASLVAVIGAVIPRKGQMLFAQAVSRITEQFPNSMFLVVGTGEGKYISQIKEYCESKGILDRVLFLGWRADIPFILAAVDLLVVAADEEPFGRTVIEAMAAGAPVVSTRCGGPEEIIIDKRTGLLVPRGDASELAKAIAHILSEPAEAARLSAAGRKRLQEVFTLEAYAHNVQSVIADVVSLASGKPA